MKRWLLSTAALVLALPLAVARPAMAAEVNTIAQAAGDKDPFVISFADAADGTITLNDDMAEILYSVFAGAQYILTDDGRLLLGHLQGNNLALIAPVAAQISFNENRYFVVHARTKDGKQFLDGRIWRSKENPKAGYAEFTFLQIGPNGVSISTHIEQDLTFVVKEDILDKPSG
jgi:hypothetical protein